MFYFGIDLGTTNSCIALYDAEYEKVIVIPNTKAEATTPSVVYLPENDKDPEVVGNVAVNQQKGKNAKRVISYTKRLIADDNACKTKDFPNYPVYNNVPQNPITISSMILKSLTFNNTNFKEKVGNEAFKAVVTFPAYFTNDARARTKQAAEIAGLKDVAMIEEPIAAALSYGFGRNQQDETLLVYDLGGGTFDVSVIQFERGRGKVLAKEGDPFLGGGDWDNAFGYYLWKRYNEETPQDIKLTMEDFDYVKNNKELDINTLRKVNTFRLLAQDAKHQLTEMPETDVLCDDDTTIHVTREDFDRETQILLRRTFAMVEDVIKNTSGINSVVLVGGSSLMPQVKDGLEKEFSQFSGKIQLHDPHLAVAKGAAIYCKMTDDIIESPDGDSDGGTTPGHGPRFCNISSFSYGIESSDVDAKGNITDTHIAILIKKGTALPAKVSEDFFTIGRTNKMRIQVYWTDVEDSRAALDQGNKIGDESFVKFDTIVPPETGVAVQMELDSAGQLHITAKSKVDGGCVDFVLKAIGLMSDAEISNFQATQKKK